MFVQNEEVYLSIWGIATPVLRHWFAMTPFLSAATTVIVVAAAIVAGATAVAQQENENQDPPQVVTAEAVADPTVVVTTHNPYLRNHLVERCRSFHRIPQGEKGAKKTWLFQKGEPSQLVKKLCHSEPVRTLAWESPGFSNIFSPNFGSFPSIRGIATLVVLRAANF